LASWRRKGEEGTGMEKKKKKKSMATAVGQGKGKKKKKAGKLYETQGGEKRGRGGALHADNT